MSQKLITFDDSVNGYLSLSIPNPFPGSTLTLQFAASMTTGMYLRVAVSLGGGNANA